MENRRKFLKKCVAGCVVMAMPGLPVYACAGRGQNPIVKTNPKQALVVWYSQTGHTGRIGGIIRHTWSRAGLMVDGADYRDIDTNSLAQYDLIAVGSPVQYMNVPRNLQDWIKKLPRIDGTSVVSYMTFGGDGNGQHSTACELLDLMTQAGGAAAGFGLFGNMSTFAPTWSVGNEERILRFKDRPNENTYRQARAFAVDILKNVSTGGAVKIERDFSLGSMMAVVPQLGFTKLLITNHHIETGQCIRCGTCLRKCPAGAIHLQTGTVDSKRCLACMGCINNCPVQAMKMNFMGKQVYGFKEFLKRHQIEIKEPAELIS